MFALFSLLPTRGEIPGTPARELKAHWREMAVRHDDEMVRCRDTPRQGH